MGFSAFHLVAKSAAAAAVLALALPAQAAGGQAETVNKIAPPAEGGSSAASERLICKRFPNTASRLKSVRACYTKEQWKKFDSERF